jgi:hypothetical protein
MTFTSGVIIFYNARPLSFTAQADVASCSSAMVI